MPSLLLVSQPLHHICGSIKPSPKPRNTLSETRKRTRLKVCRRSSVKAIRAIKKHHCKESDSSVVISWVAKGVQVCTSLWWGGEMCQRPMRATNPSRRVVGSCWLQGVLTSAHCLFACLFVCSFACVSLFLCFFVCLLACLVACLFACFCFARSFLFATEWHPYCGASRYEYHLWPSIGHQTEAANVCDKGHRY